MATGNIDSFDLKSIDTNGMIREDVMDRIFDISKIPLPLTDMIGSTKHKNEYFEWTMDELAAPNVDNAAIDGADAGAAEGVTGERVGNHSQTPTKVIAVSHRADASDTIGRAKELAYRLTRANQEIRRDVEAICLNNQASVAGTSTAAGITGGLPSWLKTNVMKADGTDGSGAAGGYDHATGLTVAATAPTAGALSFQGIKDAIQKVYEEGGEVSVLMSTPSVISQISSFMFDETARVATLTADQGKSKDKATALSSVNVLVSDFGTVKLVPNRLQPKDPTNDSDYVFLLDPEYLSQSFLEGYRTDSLAKTGLSDKRMISCDFGLRVHTEKAHAMIVGVDAALSVTE